MPSQRVRPTLVRRAESAISTRHASCFTGAVDRITGLLLGTAVGDSLGLPREGLSGQRAARLYGGPLRQRLVLGRGMLSDDTEHACMTAQALLTAGDDPVRFARALAWKLRWWLLALPAAVGWGTLRAIVRSWIGFSPSRSGVQSAGNGAAMRAPIIGAWLDDPDRVTAFVDASTRITHRDPRAGAGSLAIALAAHHAVRADKIDRSVILVTSVPELSIASCSAHWIAWRTHWCAIASQLSLQPTSGSHGA